MSVWFKRELTRRINTKGRDLDDVMAREGSREGEKGLMYMGNELEHPAPFLLTIGLQNFWGDIGECGHHLPDKPIPSIFPLK